MGRNPFGTSVQSHFFKRYRAYSRFDGECLINSYHAHFGVGGAIRQGGKTDSCRIYNGGARLEKVGSQENYYYTQETDLYSYIDSKESSYPAFDFDKEIANKDYMQLLISGINPKTAYQVIHNDEIISGSMAMAANAGRQQVADNIRSRGARASEGAIGSQPASHHTVPFR